MDNIAPLALSILALVLVSVTCLVMLLRRPVSTLDLRPDPEQSLPDPPERRARPEFSEEMRPLHRHRFGHEVAFSDATTESRRCLVPDCDRIQTRARRED